MRTRPCRKVQVPKRREASGVAGELVAEGEEGGGDLGPR